MKLRAARGVIWQCTGMASNEPIVLQKYNCHVHVLKCASRHHIHVRLHSASAHAHILFVANAMNPCSARMKHSVNYVIVCTDVESVRIEIPCIDNGWQDRVMGCLDAQHKRIKRNWKKGCIE